MVIVSYLKRHSLFPLLLLALGIRLIGISSRPIWYDEAFSILFSEKGLGAMLYGTLTSTGAGTADIHPLGYYTILWAWIQLFGTSLIAVRLLSVFIGVATVGLAYLITSDLFINDRLALLAGAFVALAPFQVHYSQEIRMYSFLAFCLMLATFSLLRGIRGKGKKWWIIFAVSSACAQYTHNLAVFYLIPLAITPLFRKDWRSLLAVILSGFCAVMLYLPWLVQVPGQFSKVNSGYWITRPDLSKIFTLLLVYVTNLPLPNKTLFVGLFISLLVFSIGLFQTFKRNNINFQALWLLYMAFLPPLLLFIISQWVPVYIERVLLPSGVIFCIWLAWAMFETSLPRLIRNSLAILLIFAAGLGIYQHVTYKGFPYAPFREMDEYLQSKIKPGDVIIHSSKLTLLPAIYYDQDLKQIFIADQAGSSVDTLAPATQQVIGLESLANIERLDRNADRVWFIMFDRSIQEYLESGVSAQPQLAWLKSNYSLVGIRQFGELRIYLFSNKL